MSFGGRRPKLHVVADFIEALGLSAFRVGDSVGMLAFDVLERPDLFMSARLSRGMGSLMAAALRSCAQGVDAAGARARTDRPRRVGTVGAERGWRRVYRRSGDLGRPDGLEEAAAHLAGQQGLIFLVSDFHWSLERLDRALGFLAHASVVPVVVWDAAETKPPERNALATLRDAESGVSRTLWVRPHLREEWRRAVAQRRSQIDSFFAARGLRPFYIEGAFDADALSRYFFEAGA
jgi:hypothetical protein